MSQVHIDLLLCGGTVDKSYMPRQEVFGFDKTHVQKMIDQAQMPAVTVNPRLLFLKDSLDMTPEERARISLACDEAASDKVIIMHGISTMIESAKAVSKTSQGGKTIVFFGAMLPYVLSGSDAMLNFGTTIMAAQLLEPGVYIAMNGRVWPHDAVELDGNGGFREVAA